MIGEQKSGQNSTDDRFVGVRCETAEIMSSAGPNGAYAKVAADTVQYRNGARWYVRYGSLGQLREGVHEVTEHEDGTITVTPSIVMPALGDGVRWHGWLRAGVFCDGAWEVTKP